jgi:hypothetical protein
MSVARTTSLILLIAALGVGCTANDGASDGASPNDAPTTGETRGTEAAEAAPPLDSAEQARVDSVLALLAACPRDGRWHECSVERRLQLAGLRPVREDSTVRIPGVDAPALQWRLGRQSIRVVLFETEAEAQAAMAGLDSARAAPRGDTTVVWEGRVTLFRAVNAVALYFGGSDRQVIRVTDALQAGPPQPE